MVNRTEGATATCLHSREEDMHRAVKTKVILTRVLVVPQSIEIKRIEKKFRQGLLGPLLRQGGEKTNKIPLFAPCGGGKPVSCTG